MHVGKGALCSNIHVLEQAARVGEQAAGSDEGVDGLLVAELQATSVAPPQSGGAEGREDGCESESRRERGRGGQGRRLP